jgi:hypothetical protein
LFGQMRAFVAQLYYCLWLLDWQLQIFWNLKHRKMPHKVLNPHNFFPMAARKKIFFSIQFSSSRWMEWKTNFSFLSYYYIVTRAMWTHFDLFEPT